MEKFGKSSADILGFKRTFFEENARLHDQNLREAAFYGKQAPRPACVVCAAALPPADFVKHGVAYALCTTCTHLNGLYDDSKGFGEIYTEEGGKTYAADYTPADAEQFRLRVEKVYVPKAEFLLDALKEQGDGGPVTVTELGAGSGYFLDALGRQPQVRAVGYEISEHQVAIGRQFSPRSDLRLMRGEDLQATIAACEGRVLTMIGVLEHLPNLREVLAAIRANARIEYVYISVPMFSLSAFIELAFPDVYHRHLGGAHTHLFTAESIDHLCREFGFRLVAEWWFGGDFMDLYRSLLVTAETSGASPAALAALHRFMQPLLDEWQVALDRSRRASEGHLLLRQQPRS